MNVAELALPIAWTSIGWALAAPLLAWAAWRTDWARLARAESSHALFGGVFLVVILWSLRGHVGDAFVFHLIGSAGLALIAGVRAALCAGALVVAISTALREVPYANAALVWLTLVAVPAVTVTAWLRLLERLLPPNFFVYIFGGCFVGGALSLLAGGAAGAALTFLASTPPIPLAPGDYAPLLVSLAFAEGTLIGMTLTLAVVHRPAWVATFDDGRYLGR